MPRSTALLLALLVLSGPAAAGPPSSTAFDPAILGRTPLPSPGNEAPALDGSAPPETPHGRIVVAAWAEAAPGGGTLRVSVTPKGRMKLVADPGITVTPEARPGVVWHGRPPFALKDGRIGYWAGPRSLALPFEAADARPIRVRVAYAYCVVDSQCFYGEERLTVARAAR